jgi:hypothetical protein
MACSIVVALWFLSEVARLIAGARWFGPRFFGVKA